MTGAERQPDAAPSGAVTATVLAVSSLTVMANATIAPSLPALAEAFADLPGIETLAGLVLSLPSLAIVLAAGAMGWLADRMDRKRLLLAAMLVYALGGAYAAVAGGMGGILVSRVLLGLGVAGTMTVATALAGDLWSGAARARFMGRQGAAMSAGGIVFLLAGGLLAGLHWRAPFAIYLAALPLMLLALRTLPALPPRGQGGASGPFPWRAFAPIAGVAFFAMLAFYLVPTRLPFLMAGIGIEAPALAGAAIAALTAASAVSSLGFGTVRARLGTAAILALAFALIAAGYAAISLAGGLAGIVPGTVLAGLGLGLAIPNLNAWLMGTMPEAVRGRAAGLMTMAVFAGQFASPLVAGLAARAFGAAGAFAAFAALLAGAAGLALLAAMRGRAVRPA